MTMAIVDSIIPAVIGTGRRRWTSRTLYVSLLWPMLLFLIGCSGESDVAAPRTVGITDASFIAQPEIGGRVLGGAPVEDPTKPEGVFVLVTLFFKNGPETALSISHSDFLLLDEDGRSHTISDDGTQAYVRSRVGTFQELELEWIDEDAVVKQLGGTLSDRPSPPFLVVPELTMSDLPTIDAAHPTPTPVSATFIATEFSDEGRNILYKELPLELGQEVVVYAIFDIPQTGIEGGLRIRFLDQEPVGLTDYKDCDESAAPRCRR